MTVSDQANVHTALTTCASSEPTSRALSAGHFRCIAKRGFGDPANAYPWGAAWFNGHMYIGTALNMLVMIAKRFPYKLPMPVWPVPIPGEGEPVDIRGQVWRYDPRQDSWTRVFRSPMTEGVDGNPTPLCCGFRNLAVFQGKSDSAPVIYTIPGCGTYGKGPVVLRCEDSRRFEVVSEQGLGLGDSTITSFRGLIPFKGRLFACPSGSRGAHGNVARQGLIICSDDPGAGLTAGRNGKSRRRRKPLWQISNTPAFGDPSNHGVFELGVFNDHLYAGTINIRHGCQLWKTRADGPPPHHWEKVADGGFGRGPHNEMIMSFADFHGALYLGTGIQNGGHDRMYGVGREAGEVIRVWPDDSWDLVVGEPRMTGQGFKAPISGLGAGFNNFFAGYIWRMCVHDGVLYVGTFDASTFLAYADPEKWPGWVRNILNTQTIEQFLQRRGGGELWRSNDGETWNVVTRNGFGNRYNYGVRTLTSTPAGLFVGMANPFGDKVAVRRGTGWAYEENPRGGIEVWQGALENSGRDGVAAPSESIDLAGGLPEQWMGSDDLGGGPGAMNGLDDADAALADGIDDLFDLEASVDNEHIYSPWSGSPSDDAAETDPFVALARSDRLTDPHYDSTEHLEEDIAAYFGYSALRNAGDWRAVADTPAHAARRLVDGLVGMLPQQESNADGSILVIGAGASEIAELVRSARPDASVHLIAATRAQRRQLRRESPESKILLSRRGIAGLARYRFDAVLSVENLMIDADAAGLAAASRCLVPGGSLVAAELLGRKRSQSRAAVRKKAAIIEEFDHALRNAGFSDVTILDMTDQGWLRFFQHSRSYFLTKYKFQLLSRERMSALLDALPGGTLEVAAHVAMSARKQEM